MDTDHYRAMEPFWGKWNIVRELGAGSYGKVFEIKREDFNIHSALKIVTIPPEKKDWDEAMRRYMDERTATSYFKSVVDQFVKEIGLLSELRGQGNIVSYEDHDVIEHDDHHGWDILLRMELLTPFQDSLPVGRFLERDRVIKLGMDICSALKYCQSKNVIHRDVKPGNVFLSASGDYKIGDFGIARTADKTMGMTNKAGSINYMAPEVYKGGEYGPRVDIYSLGIMLYELCNRNRLPFYPPYPELIGYNDEYEAIGKRMNGEAMPLPADAQDELGRVILKACAYDPADRYANAEEFRLALEAVAAVSGNEQAPEAVQTATAPVWPDPQQDMPGEQSAQPQQDVVQPEYRPQMDTVYSGQQPVSQHLMPETGGNMRTADNDGTMYMFGGAAPAAVPGQGIPGGNAVPPAAPYGQQQIPYQPQPVPQPQQVPQQQVPYQQQSQNPQQPLPQQQTPYRPQPGKETQPSVTDGTKGLLKQVLMPMVPVAMLFILICICLAANSWSLSDMSASTAPLILYPAGLILVSAAFVSAHVMEKKNAESNGRAGTGISRMIPGTVACTVISVMLTFTLFITGANKSFLIFLGIPAIICGMLFGGIPALIAEAGRVIGMVLIVIAMGGTAEGVFSFISFYLFEEIPFHLFVIQMERNNGEEDKTGKILCTAAFLIFFPFIVLLAANAFNFWVGLIGRTLKGAVIYAMVTGLSLLIALPLKKRMDGKTSGEVRG
ncbi:MAG: protein kinase [Lachnospiraceae bacterium]|nr:protein kinase [Lachnospiraceae bacterium]